MAVLRKSPWYSEIAQEGYDEGMQQGRQQGMQQGRRDVAIGQLNNVLRHRFGPLPQGLLDSLFDLPTDDLLSLFDVALEVESVQVFQTRIGTNGKGASSANSS